jgi:hypothetical protein
MLVVQIVYSWRKGSRRIAHVGSAHDDVELELLKQLPGSGSRLVRASSI